MPQPDWQQMFVPSVSPLEIVLRGTIMYLALFLLLRVVLNRQSGTFSLTDVLMIVLLADAAQNGMAGEYKSITDGLILVGTLVGWNYLLNYIGYRNRWVERLLHPPALKLIDQGRLLRKNMRREFITEVELLSQIHEQGLESFEQVKEAYMEGDGEISIIKKDDKGDDAHRKHKTPGAA